MPRRVGLDPHGSLLADTIDTLRRLVASAVHLETETGTLDAKIARRAKRTLRRC